MNVRKPPGAFDPATADAKRDVAAESARWVKEAFEPSVRVYYPAPILTTDNAAMIAAAGTPKLGAAPGLPLDLNAAPNLRLC